jgi:hypothetical protein
VISISSECVLSPSYASVCHEVEIANNLLAWAPQNNSLSRLVGPLTPLYGHPRARHFLSMKSIRSAWRLSSALSSRVHKGAFDRALESQQGFFSSCSAASWSAASPTDTPATSFVPLFIDGSPVQSTTDIHMPLLNPATQELLGSVPEATEDEVRHAVSSSVRAFHSWKNTPVPIRARVMLEYQALIRRDMDALAASITQEQVCHVLCPEPACSAAGCGLDMDSNGLE